MLQSRSPSIELAASLVLALVLVPFASPGATGQEPEATGQEPETTSQEPNATLSRARDLFAARESKRVVTPVPGSRSIVVAFDGSSDFYLYVERGSIRGNAIDTFYEQLEAGQTDEAYNTFVQNSVVTMRVSDYGWNGLGRSLTTESGSEIADVYYTVTEGIFQRVDPSDEEKATYQELIHDVLLPALQGEALQGE